MLELAQTLAVAAVLLGQWLVLREQRLSRKTMREQSDELRQLKTSLRPGALRRALRFRDEDGNDSTPPA
jgi:hypothetical protein